MTSTVTPLVSVIVTTYNRKELLRDTIKSILNQTYEHFELIVVDNHSRYDFLSFIDTIYDERIRPFQNQNHGNIAVNRNFGIKQAHGELVAFCDDDDLWLETKLEKQVATMNEDPSLTLVSTDAYRFNQEHDSYSEFYPHSYQDTPNLRSLIKRNPVITSSVLARKIAITGAGGFPTEPKLKTIEDHVLWVLVRVQGKIRVLDEKLVNYRVHLFSESERFQKNRLMQRFYMLSYLSEKLKLSKVRLFDSYLYFTLQSGWYKLRKRITSV